MTDIHRVHNQRAHKVRITNVETPSDTDCGKGDLAAGEEKDLLMWIPWAETPLEFAFHHIMIEFLDARGEVVGVRAIWQRNIKSGPGRGDLVRASHGAFIDPGEPIGGTAAAGGGRWLIIEEDGALRLLTYTA